MHAITVGDALRKRLQLILGQQVTLGDEIPSRVAGRAFAGAMVGTAEPVAVTVHRAPPEGPDPFAMHERLVALRELGHGVLTLPLADGEVDGHCWIVDVPARPPKARDHANGGRLPLPVAVSAIRDLARALAAMHRRGITHGAIGLDNIAVGVDGAKLGGLGQALQGTVRGDLDALGFVAWALLSGDVDQASMRPLSRIRRGVPASLDALCASFCARNSANRPQRAEAILEVLDSIPTQRHNPLASIVDAGWHDGRPRRTVGWLVVAVLVVLALLLATRR